MEAPIVADTADDLLLHAVSALLERGTALDPAPTKGACVEMTGVAMELRNPLARVSTSAGRGRVYSALGELAWYLSGSNKLEDVAYYIARYKAFAEDGRIHGAY